MVNAAALSPYYWRLVYPDDSVMDEPLDHASILLSRPGAVELHVCSAGLMQGERHPRMRLPLHDDSGRLFRPIFYRKHSMNADSSDHTMDCTVIGRGTLQVDDPKLSRAERQRMKRDGAVDVNAPVQFDCFLMAALGERAFVQPPPAWAIDQTAIENLLVNTY